MEIMKAITKRKSIRSYKQDQIPEETLTTLLAAGCASPIGKSNKGKLHFTIMQGTEILQKVSDATRQILNFDRDPLYGAPTIIVISIEDPKVFPGGEFTNAGCIAQNIMLAATEAGVGSVLIWGPGLAIEADETLKKAISIPDGYKVLCSVALGYAATDDQSEKELKVTIPINRV